MRLFALIACVASLSAVSVSAKTFTYAFEAGNPTSKANNDPDISVADRALALAEVQGGEITGTITFDDTILSATPDQIIYAPLVIKVDGLDQSSVAPGRRVLFARNWDNSGLDDISSESLITSTEPEDAIDILWRDLDSSLFDSGEFPGNLDMIEYSIQLLVFYNPFVSPQTVSTTDRTDFDITSLTLIATSTPAVPLPAGLPLLVGALAALGALRARRK